MNRIGLAACLLALGSVAGAQEWNLAEAAAPYEGVTIKALFWTVPVT